ncbi:MAG: DUF3108 domain-containing protein [Cytophagales bacterium]|nr:DUF3108 domain-containing protein [Cytophagales bacterium]
MSVKLAFVITFIFSSFFTYEYNHSQAAIELERDNFSKGELLTYRLHYGFITAGKATIAVDNDIYDINKKPCYSISVTGSSIGTFDLFIKIRDTWSTYIDTTDYVPQKSVRNIEEGRYKLLEEATYYYAEEKVNVLRMQPGRQNEVKDYKVPHNVQDIVSGFYYLRRINFNKLTKGDTLSINAFFDKNNYKFRVRYMGKGTVKTDAGKFRAIKLVPVMPKNTMFDGEESIKVWISDDKNKIPLLAEAEMYVGAVQLELTQYKGLRNQPSFIKK